MTHSVDLHVTAEQYEEHIAAAAAVVRERLGEADICIVLGSGLNGFATTAFGDDVKVLSYADIPHMPETAVVGHFGKVFAGLLHGRRCICFAGRFHSYEGYPGHVVSFLPRLAAAVGCKLYMLTNAAGGAGAGMVEGCGMAITDHSCSVGWSAIRDTAPTRAFPANFTAEEGIYCPELVNMASTIAREIDFPFFEGVYQFNSGPTYESPAEVALFAKMGVSTFGMSSVPEALAAKEAGMRVFGMSLVTNLAAGMSSAELTHEEVTEVATKAGASVSHIMSELIRRANVPEAPLAAIPAAKDEVTRAVAAEAPMVLPAFVFPARAEVEIDAQELVQFCKGRPLVVLTTGVEQAGMTLATKGPRLHTLRSVKAAAPHPLSRAGFAARFGTAKTPAGTEVAVIFVDAEESFPEGLAFHEVIPTVVAATAAGATLVHSVIPAICAKGCTNSAVLAVADHVNCVRDPVAPALPKCFAGATAAPAKGVVVGTYPGPLLPGQFTKHYYQIMGCDVITSSTAAALVYAPALGYAASATAVVGTPAATEVAAAVEAAVAAAPAAAPAVAAEFHVGREHSFHLFTPTFGTQEDVDAAVAAARATMGEALAKVDVTRVLVVNDTASARAAVTAVLGPIVEDAAAGLGVAGNQLIAFVPLYTSGHSAARIQLPIRAAVALGANAAVFAAHAAHAPAGVVRATDHINISGENSLRGVNVDSWGARFPDCSYVYKACPEGGDADGYVCWAMATHDTLSGAEKAFITGPEFKCSAIVTDGALQTVYVARHAGMRMGCFAGEDLTKTVEAAVEAVKKI